MPEDYRISIYYIRLTDYAFYDIFASDYTTDGSGINHMKYNIQEEIHISLVR